MLNIKPQERMETIGIRLPASVRAQLNALAKSQQTDVSKVTRAILEKYFDESDTDCKQKSQQSVDQSEANLTPEA